jgi:P pilus assembly chaperone PapD
MKFSCKATAVVLAASLLSGFSLAAGAAIVIDGTRVIYPAKSREVTIRLSNQGSTPMVAQSWVDAGRAQVSPAEVNTPFLLVPPLARIEPSRGQTLRLMMVTPPDVTDRESVYYLNVLEIPPKATEAEGSSLQLTLRSRIKVFFRPETLIGKAADAPATLTWRIDRQPAGTTLVAENPSAYHVSFGNVTLHAGASSINLPSGMVAPKSTMSFALGKAPTQGQLTVDYSSIDDYGAQRKLSKSVAS